MGNAHAWRKVKSWRSSRSGWKLALRCLVLAFCLQGDPSVQAAEHESAGAHGEAHLDLKRLAFQLINFGILVGILGYFGGRAINRALAARHEQLKRDLEEALQARAAAETRLRLQERRLANLEKEVSALRTSIKEEGLIEEKRLLEAAEEKSRRIVEETRFLMDQEVKQAEIRLREEVAAEAIRIAEQVVLRSVKPEDEKRLGQSFVSDLLHAGPEDRPPGGGNGSDGGGSSGKIVTGLQGGEEAHS